MHGGSTKAAKAIAEKARERQKVERVVGRQIADLLEDFEIENEHPLDGLLDAVRRSGALMRLLGAMVGELEPKYGWQVDYSEDGERRVVLATSALYGPNHAGDAVPHVLVAMYNEERDRYARVCKLALDAGIDERLVRNAEATSERLFSAIRSAMEKAALPPDVSRRFREALATELRAVIVPGEGSGARSING